MWVLKSMEFRIGVHLGDVIENEKRIYGDGVNIAARLEGLAEGGGVCISSSVYEQVKNKLTFGYEFLGARSVKNIAEPIKAYRVLLTPEDGGKVIGEKRSTPKRWRWAAIGGAVVLVVVAGAIAFWNYYIRLTPPTVEATSKEKMAFHLPDKPSIAVLPFTNISGDKEQEYFSDGITEDLITDLSKISGLFIIARNSTFAYKGKSVEIRQAAEELGVRYVLADHHPRSQRPG